VGRYSMLSLCDMVDLKICDVEFGFLLCNDEIIFDCVIIMHVICISLVLTIVIYIYYTYIIQNRKG